MRNTNEMSVKMKLTQTEHDIQGKKQAYRYTLIFKKKNMSKFKDIFTGY